MTRNVLTLAPVALALVFAAGCEVAEPQLPTFTTRVTIPLGEERLDVADALDGEEYLCELDGHTLGFTVDGDPDTVALAFDLAADIPAQSVAESLGEFEITLTDPVDFDFVLAELYPPAGAFDGQTTLVPPFPITQASEPEDVPDVESALLSSGNLTVTVHNGLPVPVADVTLELVDPATGVAFATVSFDAIAPGADAEREADLAGASLPGSASVRLAGGSPGSGVTPVLVDAQARIAVHAAFADLSVSSAVAVVGPQEFTTAFSSDLPEDYGVVYGVIASGATSFAAVNEMSIPCQATLTWPALLDLDDQPLTIVFDVPAQSTVQRAVDFAGYVVRGTLEHPVTTLTGEIRVTSDGSGGQPVALAASQGLRAEIAPGAITFGSVTGTLPELDYAFDPLDEEIDLPDELDGLELTAASLVLELENTAGVPAAARFELVGTSAAGARRSLTVDEAISPSDGERAAVTTIALDQHNSEIVDFLNNLPTRITLAGSVHVPGGTLGTVHGGDRAIVRWRIVAPVEVVVQDAYLEGDPEDLDLDDDARDLLRDHSRGALADLEVLNHLPLGVELRLLFSPDTTSIVSDPLVAIGPISVPAATRDPVTRTVAEPSLSHPQVSLTAEQARLLGTEGLYSQIEVHLPDSGGESARVLTTDYLTVRGIIRLDVDVTDD